MGDRLTSARMRSRTTAAGCVRRSATVGGAGWSRGRSGPPGGCSPSAGPETQTCGN